ncbi:UDP-N-acetylmuramoyl-L-alanyl-D-glutamate--2,6-diaminopimelate ligase [Solicola sp. PLA-1-18]|uniref:UDP-N-acetylmuramoyl-L-alanyl-D-glutamate--2, 6-diaminopimelate ligase n=1 Tax=Solicola sp. PLA-1-18 TaxID=3380532 RepID=UPI003B765DFA
MTDPTPLDDRPQTTVPVRLADLAALVGADVDGDGDTAVTGLTLASAAVRPGDLYAALPGARTHGARYAADAVTSGAVAVLTDAEGAAVGSGLGVPLVVVESPRRHLGTLAAAVYGHPGRRLRTVGVTGTQGKTTTTQLAQSALRACGAVPAVVGTLGTRVDGRPVRSALTTPEAPALHALLGVMVEQGVDAVAMEVSSHALVQGRVDGVVYDAAVFLNLGRDHLDFHPTVEDYFQAKATLFTPEHAAVAVINVDDEHGRRLAASTSLPVTSIAVDADADWTARDLRPGPTSTTARLLGPDGVDLELVVPLPGEFNVLNALAVVAGLAAVGYDPAAAVAGLAASPGVPGRMERVDAGQEFAAFVDYAHKPDALSAVLRAVRPVTTGKVVLVIGAGGDRDTGKRPIMGRVAAELADLVVVTDDNPRSEDPAAIRAEVLAGAREVASGAEVLEGTDRASAIVAAVRACGPGDCLVVAGKGDETGQDVAGVVHPFDDREVLRDALHEVLAGGAR